MMWFAIGSMLAAFLFWGWALCRAAAKVVPKPPKREGWHTDENGPYWN